MRSGRAGCRPGAMIGVQHGPNQHPQPEAAAEAAIAHARPDSPPRRGGGGGGGGVLLEAEAARPPPGPAPADLRRWGGAGWAVSDPYNLSKFSVGWRYLGCLPWGKCGHLSQPRALNHWIAAPLLVL